MSIKGKILAMNRQRNHTSLSSLSRQLLIITAVLLPTSALRTRTTNPYDSQHRLDPNSGLSVGMTAAYEVPLRIDQAPPYDTFRAPDLVEPSYVDVPTSHIDAPTSHVRSTDNYGSSRRGGPVATIRTSDPLGPTYEAGSNHRTNESTCTSPDQCRNAGDCAAGGTYSSCGFGKMCCPPKAAFVSNSHAQNAGIRNLGPKRPVPTKSSAVRESAMQGSFDQGLPAAFHGYLLLSEHPQMPQPLQTTGFARTKPPERRKTELIISPEYESGRYGGPPIRLGTAGNRPLSSLKQKEINLLPDGDTCGFLFVNDRIIRGQNGQIGEFPWMALLGFRTSSSTAVNFICAGTLINKHYVLTAAHCFTNQNALVEVRLGEYDLSQDPDDTPQGREEPVKKEEAEEIILHPSFSRSQLSNDIALIRLKNKIREYTKTIKPICLPLDVTFIGMDYTVAGWGKTDYRHSNGSNIIQKTTVTVMNRTDCLKRAAPYNLPITTNQICAGGNKGHDVCSGDSGGPLTKEGNANSPDAPSTVFIVGIVSFGSDMPCGTAGLPSVYTNVTSYLSWILENIRA